MKKIYENPELEIIEFAADVITTSGDPYIDGDNDFGYNEFI